MLPWAPMSLVIKGLMAYTMCRLAGGKQAGPWRMVLGLLLASFINVAGYFLGKLAGVLPGGRGSGQSSQSDPIRRGGRPLLGAAEAGAPHSRKICEIIIEIKEKEKYA